MTGHSRCCLGAPCAAANMPQCAPNCTAATSTHLLRLLVCDERYHVPQPCIMVERSAPQRGQRALSVAQRADDVAPPARVGQWPRRMCGQEQGW